MNLITCLVFSIGVISKVSAQNGSQLTVDSVFLTTNPADVANLIPIGQVDALTNAIYLGSEKRLEKIAVLSLKQQAVAQGANLILVKSKDYFYRNDNPSGIGGNKVHMVGVLYKGKISPNNATQSAATNPADLSGSWVGYHINGELVCYYELDLQKTGDNKYSGVDYVRWEKTTTGSPMHYEGSVVPNSTKVLVGSFKDGYLSFDEIGIGEGDKWGLMSEKFQLSNNSGVSIMINGDGNNGRRKFSLKRSGDYPPKYLKYVVNGPVFKVDTVNYHNQALAESIKYNEKGFLEFTVSNKTPISFQGLKTILTIGNNGEGIDYNGANEVSFDIAAGDKTTVDIPISTNMMLPAGSLSIKLIINSNGMLLASKDFKILANGFFKNDNVTGSSYSSARMRAVGGFYGLNSTLYKNVSISLDPLVASGDKMAAMWKAVFLSMGYGEYKIDETLGNTFGKSALKTVENAARNGDAEALYLMFYACQMGLEGEAAKPFAASFLEKAANAGFKPAIYDYAGQLVLNKDYSGAYVNFSKSYNLGVAKAATVIGQMYEKGLGVTPDIDIAVEWYKKGMAFGDPEATLCYAELVAKGINNTPPNITKALELATVSAAKNCPDATIFIGKIYSEGKKGIPQNISMAIKWFKAGADMGDRQAMYELGETYITSKHGITKDENSGLFWIKRAAELGSPRAMIMLANCYNQGAFAEKDIIAGRYWYNQAVLSGFARTDATGLNASAQTFMDFWKYADFSPSYIYVNEYGEKIGDGDDGLENGLITGIFGAMRSYYLNQQQLIDGLEFIHKKNGLKVYGGTVSSNFVSSLFLKKGQTVHIRSYGIISTGMMSGLANADGLGNAWAEYRIVQNIPCSAVMAGVTGSSWQFIGQNNTYTAPKDGALVLALNGIDYANYKGYFDLVIEVPEN